jgi:hypothetical protein
MPEMLFLSTKVSGYPFLQTTKSLTNISVKPLFEGENPSTSGLQLNWMV